MKLEKLDNFRWLVPRSGHMRVPGLIFTSESLLKDLEQDQSLRQVANVATLPGIRQYALAMPDIHWGYGFPIGGVAAFDMEEGIISPGGVGYDNNFETYGELSTRLSRIMTEMVDMNINMPILKDHSLAGLSGGMKNMFGAIFNPNKYHDNHCSPYAAHVSALATVKRKNRLTVIDAARVQYNGGPGFMPEYLVDFGSIILSNDPVSADRVGLEILERLRSKNSLPPLEQTGRPVEYLQVGEEIGLGTADISKIDLTIVNLNPDGTFNNGELL